MCASFLRKLPTNTINNPHPEFTPPSMPHFPTTYPNTSIFVSVLFLGFLSLYFLLSKPYASRQHSCSLPHAPTPSGDQQHTTQEKHYMPQTHPRRALSPPSPPPHPKNKWRERRRRLQRQQLYICKQHQYARKGGGGQISAPASPSLNVHLQDKRDAQPRIPSNTATTSERPAPQLNPQTTWWVVAQPPALLLTLDAWGGGGCVHIKSKRQKKEAKTQRNNN